MSDIKNKLKNPPKKYRTLPFWSWNTKLDVNETKWQIEEMDKVGTGGFFMHARGGLKTEYMGKEWMENVRESILDASERGMYAWGYDENGWPSGFGSDAVNGLGVEYQQKYLRMEITDTPVNGEFTITNKLLSDGKNAHFYYDINKFYVDTLDSKVTDKFLEVIHEKYKEILGDDFSKMAGFFTDEPQVSRNGLPWSFVLEREYRKDYNDELLPLLYDLFEDTDTSVKTRYRFWKLVTKLFCESYAKRIYDWCEQNGTQLTGHMVCEDHLMSQLDSNGAIMPNYEYYHIPGIDRLTRSAERSLLVPQVTSACAQLGKKQILTESFAMCGWDVSFEELKWILEWQMVKGVNLLCQHLEGYSLEGLRKRDYPAGHFYQNPWWKEYKDFMDFSSRMGMLLAEGGICCDVLVLHTISTAWTLRGNDSLRHTIDLYNYELIKIGNELDKNQILYHLGDERLMSRYGSVDGKKLHVCKMSYSTVIVPPSVIIDRDTYKLLKEFSDNGGNLIFIGEVPSYIDGDLTDNVKNLCKVHVENEVEAVKLISKNASYCSALFEDGTHADVQFARRIFDDFEMFYFVNPFADKCENVTLSIPGKSCACFNYLTGETEPCKFTYVNGCVKVIHTFEKMGSYVLFVRKDDEYKSALCENKQLVSINDKLIGEWEVKESDPNVLTLDRCDCYFDGELVEKNMYILDIQEKACALNRKVKIKFEFNVCCNMSAEKPMFLVLEQPDNYRLYINGAECEKKKCGYYRDKSFIKLDISGTLKNGENLLTLECDFVQPKQVYDQLDNCLQFESAKNKLWFDMEIEPVYIIGEFGVDCDEQYEYAENESVRTLGSFTLCDMPKTLTDGDFTVQKLPFFCGHIKVKKDIDLNANEISNRSIELERLCSTVSSFTVNDKKLDNMYWAPYTADLKELLKEGKNTIELDITGNFRNMLGPHHIPFDSHVVGPTSFHHNSPIWGGMVDANNWYDGYCFVKYGLFLKK